MLNNQLIVYTINLQTKLINYTTYCEIAPYIFFGTISDVLNIFRFLSYKKPYLSETSQRKIHIICISTTFLCIAYPLSLFTEICSQSISFLLVLSFSFFILFLLLSLVEKDCADTILFKRLLKYLYFISQIAGRRYTSINSFSAFL